MEKIKSILKNKITITSIMVILVLLFVFILINNSKKVTKLERIMIEEYSDEYSDYFDEILNDKDNDCRHINFVLEYLLNTQDIKKVSNEDVRKYIKDILGIDYSYDDIVNVSVMQNKLKSGFSYIIKDKEFKFDSKITRSDIIKKPLVKYEIKNIKRKGKNKFVVNYTKYIIENPYDLYNYYNDLNLNKESDEKKEDITDLLEYLKGNRKVSSIKRFINEDSIKKVGKTVKNVKIEYELKDNKLNIIEKK